MSLLMLQNSLMSIEREKFANQSTSDIKLLFEPHAFDIFLHCMASENCDFACQVCLKCEEKDNKR